MQERRDRVEGIEKRKIENLDTIELMLILAK